MLNSFGNLGLWPLSCVLQKATGVTKDVYLSQLNSLKYRNNSHPLIVCLRLGKIRSGLDEVNFWLSLFID